MSVDILDILEKNRDKSFVKRILEPEKYGYLDNGDGSISTHSMSWGEFNGKYYVFPTVLREKGGGLRRYNVDEAWDHTQKTGNFIEFDNAEDADYFSKHYKDVWGME